MEKEELKDALVTMNRQQAADHFGVHLATVKRAIKRYGINYKKKSGGCHLYRDKPLDPDIGLTQEQRDVLIGSLLADGFLLKTNIFRIKQKHSRREYVGHLHGILSPFSTPLRTDKARKPTRVNGKVSHRLEDWKGGYCKVSSFSTRRHPIFERLRQQWYPNGHKIVPEFELNESVLTHWYLQDGSYSPKFGMVRLSCNSFTKVEIEKLISMLRNIGIQSKLTKNQSYDVIDIYADHIVFLDKIQLRPACFRHKFKKA